MRARGFTIVEMLVVLTILGLSMTAVPAIVSSLDGSRLRAATDEFVAHLRQARNQAVRTQAPVDVVIDLRRRRYTTSAEAVPRELPPVVDRVEIGPAGLADPNGIARFRFQADGSTVPVRILLWRGARSMDIEVEWLTGRVGSGG